jgi:predicted nucleotide-binding protein with TIR-like domain
MSPEISEKVFVVHGRNENARDSLFQFLRAIGLHPIEWSKAVSLTKKASPFVGEILEAAFSHAQAVVVLLTGDDEVRLRNELFKEHEHEYERTFKLQARPNVLFEAGMAFAVHPDRTVLVELGTVKPFSDIAGRHVIKMNNSTEKRQDLAERLKLAGCLIDISGRDWHNVGNFEILVKELVNEKGEPQIKENVNQGNEKRAIYISGMHEGAVKILQLLSDIEEQGLKDISPKGIADRLLMRRTAIKHHIEVLYFSGYIGRSFKNNIVHYDINPKGRAFLVENSLI